MSAPRRRLDAELVRRGLVTSRAEGQQAIDGGLVTVDGAPALKAATQVHAGQALVVLAPPRRFVSRGGDKLARALERFSVDPRDRHCLDAGVSTGGFTDCLLQHGAATVVAYDVGYGQVHDRIRADPRVQVHERTNVRGLVPGDLAEPRPDLLVADLSFISLALVLPGLLALLDDEAHRDGLVLIKPQFEAQRSEVGRGGVVKDPGVWQRCVLRVAEAAAQVGWEGFDVTASPLLGPSGNVEFLAHLQPTGPDSSSSDPDALEASRARRAEAAIAEGLALKVENRADEPRRGASA